MSARAEDVQRTCVRVLDALWEADVARVVAAMEPNANTIAAGLCALFMWQGETDEEIIARFVRKREALRGGTAE